MKALANAPGLLVEAEVEQKERLEKLLGETEPFMKLFQVVADFKKRDS
jgi:hypothetical protein